MDLKAFCAEIINDHKSLAAEHGTFREIPEISAVTQKEVLENYLAIKKEVQNIIQSEMERMMDTPGLAGLIIWKENN